MPKDYYLVFRKKADSPIGCIGLFYTKSKKLN
ncbi:hypothetical protein DespoDRAFT_00285 [Desulfobacter postgatei 2ac9]|jgi:hypothetical protein|uniref:Uncharacterized protein n=1 Tax=Desulfobacter postgatei 2ac9 TaxID=879212 RepID=I5AYK4_9BACT|nr:hypothetical protein DespoDRAFT_00285 [Desulfobacter postgatei 2ac9]